MDKPDFQELFQRAEAAFGNIDNVVGVSFGLKEVAGKVTDELAFRVYVKKKLGDSQIAKKDRIPKEFEGYPTDVVIPEDPRPLHCEDISYHSPLIGGISLTNFKLGAASGAGTLGFFATVNGMSGPKNVVLVSNNHVISTAAVAGDPIYQPTFIVLPDGSIPFNGEAEHHETVAKLHHVGMMGNHSFAYPGESANDYFLDCASALLDISISSWCNSNCGVSYNNEIRGLNIANSSKVAGIARVKSDTLAAGDYVVYKVGRRTSRTVGKILDPFAVSISGGRIIVVVPTAPDCDGIMRFATTGDSGSALINANREIIGLIYGESTVNPDRIYCSHIHPVLDYLGITAITEANPPVGPAGKALVETSGSFDGGTRESIALRDRLRATPKGADYHARIRQHAQEVVELVNHCRPVTVAWHRSKGPVWFGHFSSNLRDPDHPIPLEVDSIARQAVIARMAEMLCAHGSAELQATIAAYRAEADALADSFNDLRQLAERFEAEAAEASHG
jgi:hypothetical protein